ncbi:Peptidyl-prolyl cis-trans isomerase CWC27 like protein [Eufriesea mexicana]|uniref:Peptidyl-prolyl cis-trans isomerase CWC27 like protein n=1 Tax=Eufriesea mexicana TaxID=516756 RepID=A0A310SJW5_9HYME|nr:Peptidyl-prolyl cis-trans isomerase CWC27 like protein [Eufriesea mexicana]
MPEWSGKKPNDGAQVSEFETRYLTTDYECEIAMSPFEIFILGPRLRPRVRLEIFVFDLQNKHTIFDKVTGETIYNILKLEEALVDENDRPLYSPKLMKTIILNNPFSDIIPRIIGQESEEVKDNVYVKFSK